MASVLQRDRWREEWRRLRGEMKNPPQQRVLNVILSHQTAPEIGKMLSWWEKRVPIESIVIACGGPHSEFEALNHKSKILIDDPRLRTRDHQRELQSYSKLFQQVSQFLDTQGRDFEFVHFIEYDHLPLVEDLNERQINRLIEERADVIGFHLHRVDGTSDAHYLYHASNEKFANYWSEITCRTEPEVVLSMFGSGSFWKREAFDAVASVPEPFPIYMELYLPTLAHHLGFRLRDFEDQNRFIGVLRDKTRRIARAQAEGAWTLHPVKYLWDR